MTWFVKIDSFSPGNMKYKEQAVRMSADKSHK